MHCASVLQKFGVFGELVRGKYWMPTPMPADFASPTKPDSASFTAVQRVLPPLVSSFIELD